MATIIDKQAAVRLMPDTRFFLVMAIVMAALNVAAFSLFAAMGISSFGEPLYVHVHAFTFFGWVVLYLAQNGTAAAGALHMHRTLGWLGTVWAGAMVVVGTVTTVLTARLGHVPFIFTPAYFLIMNPVNALTFAGLVWAGVLSRRNTGWHRRLIYCGMAAIMGPAFGRLLPPPVLIAAGVPTVATLMLLFVVVGAVRDRVRLGRVHPAYWVGGAAHLAMWTIIGPLAQTALGAAIYDAAVAGSPGAAKPALIKAHFPG